MVEYEGRGRPWERRESAIVEATALLRFMVEEEQSDLNFKPNLLCLRENRHAGGPKTRR